MAAKRLCSIEGCNKPTVARGWCVTHYARWRKHGDPNGGKFYGEAERFYQEVALLHDGDECLFWPFARVGGRYGNMRHNGESVLVHRRLCEEVNGPPPTEKHEAAHSCGNGHMACVAKNHLTWKTHIENMADRAIHGTENRGDRNGLAKLNEEDVRKIRKMKGTASPAKIGAKFGVSGASVWQIYNGKSWTWVE